MFEKSGLKTLLRLLKEIVNRKLPYYTGLFGNSLVEASIIILIPIIIKYMIDAVTQNNMDILRQGVLLAVFEAVLTSSLFIWVINLLWKTVHQITADLKIKMTRRIMELPVAFYEKTHSGDLISRITNDINNLYGTLGWLLREILLMLFSGVGSAVLMIILDFRFSIILFVLGVISAIPNIRCATRIKGISDDIQTRMGKITEKVSDLLGGHFIVKMFHIADSLDEKFMEHNEYVKKQSILRTVQAAKLDVFNHFISWINFGGVIVLGAYLSITGSVDFGTVVAEMNLMGNVNWMIRRMGGLVTGLQSSLSGVGRVFELLDAAVEPEHYQAAAGNIRNGDYMIEMQDVQFTYDHKEQVLKGVDLTLKESGMAALVGASGGGKSTIAKLLLGYYPAEKGAVLINRRPIWEYKLEELRDLIAYVPQDAFIFDGTIEENIRFGKETASSEDIVEAAQAANAYGFIMEMPDKMQTRVGERGVRLSGGQRQRIAIARAVLKNAPILILDEATSALDSESEQLVQDALNTLMKGRTSVVIAHRLSTIEKADIIYVVEDGKITEQGSHTDLLQRNGAYKRLYECQFAG